MRGTWKSDKDSRVESVAKATGKHRTYRGASNRNRGSVPCQCDEKGGVEKVLGGLGRGEETMTQMRSLGRCEAVGCKTTEKATPPQEHQTAH